MRTVWALILGLGLGRAVAQEGTVLDAEAFDSLTRGKTLDTFLGAELYGLEQFLPGRQTIWKDATGCKRSTWVQIGAQICFAYEDDPDAPACWIYTLDKGEIQGWYRGRMDGAFVRLVPGNTPMVCDFHGV